jgi:hypothetical protein
MQAKAREKRKMACSMSLTSPFPSIFRGERITSQRKDILRSCWPLAAVLPQASIVMSGGHCDSLLGKFS